MCGRLNLSHPDSIITLLERFGLHAELQGKPRYNVAPTQHLDVVTGGDDQPPALTVMRWGLPLTLRGKSGQAIEKTVFNTRSDKAFTSPLWKPLMRRYRALLPVNGFYEWQRRGKSRQAFYIHPATDDAMWLAAVYRPATEALPEVSILTTEANATLRAVHDRMPVVLAGNNAARAWLNEQDQASLQALMLPAEEQLLSLTPVGDYVNNSRHEGAECIRPVAAHSAQ